MTRERDRIQENANGYVVRNCPSAKYRMGMPWKILCEKESNCVKSIYCADCTDCIVKQVIEKCKDAHSECSCKNPNKDVDCFECTSGGRAELGVEILQLFDIEEINK